MTSNKQQIKLAPKVFAIVVCNGEQTISLWVGVAYLLEDAIILAKQQAQLSAPTVPITQLIPRFYFGIEVDELVKAVHIIERKVEVHTSSEPQEEQKSVVEISNLSINELMQKIIETKDVELFKESKGRLTKEQKKLICDRLKEKNNEDI